MAALLEYIGNFSCKDLITFLKSTPGNMFMFSHICCKQSCVTCRPFFFFLIFEVEKTFPHQKQKKKIWPHEINTEFQPSCR